MEGVRFFLAIVLSIAVIIVTNLLFGPEQPAGVPADSTAVDTVAVDTVVVPADTAQAPPAVATPAPDTAAPTPTPAPAAADAGLPADTLWVETPLARYGFSTRGAAVVSVELLQFQSFTDDGPVQLVPPGGRLIGYDLVFGERTLELGAFAFEPDTPRDTVRLAEGAAPHTLRFSHLTESGFAVELEYTIDPGRYVVDVAGALRGVEGTNPTLLLKLGRALRVNEADSAEDQRSMGYVVNNRQEGISSVKLEDVEEERIEEGPLSWVALKSKYWVAVAFTDETGSSPDFGGLIARPLAEEYAADMSATLPVGRDAAFSFHLFLGPQDFNRLAELGRDLPNVNPIGYRIFQPIIRPLARLATWLLVELHGVFGFGYGWVLILFGAIMRLVLWPLNAKAMRSQVKTMELQPRIKEIQEKYKEKPEIQQREMLKLYKEEGFNPLGGCLPMLLPWPVLITLFFVFQNTIEFRGVEFLWLPDLSRPDPYYLLPVILGVSFFLMQYLSMRTSPKQNPQQKMLMYFMPIFMVVIFVNLASGLNLYYAASNIFSVPQQIQIVRERRKAHARLERKKEKEEDEEETGVSG